MVCSMVLLMNCAYAVQGIRGMNMELIVKTDEQLQNMMIIALNACAIEFAGFDYDAINPETGKFYDDPKTTAARLVFEVLTELGV